MMELTFPFLAGIIAAVFHVISGPDHLAAVTPFAIESKRRAWKVGLFWGIGHLSGMLSIGVLFLLFKELIPVERISTHSEKMVGVILIGLALWIFFKIFKDEKQHKHTHVHADTNPIIHKHEHFHPNSKTSIIKTPHIHNTHEPHTHKNSNLKQGKITSLSVGFIHGLAGVAHFLLFLPVIGFTSKLAAVQYIVGFAAGTLFAMIIVAFIIGKIAGFTTNKHNSIYFKGLRLASGFFAFVIGVYWFMAN